VVLLTSGEIAVVTHPGDSPLAHPERPTVRLVFDGQSRSVDGPEIDLSQDPRRQVLWPLNETTLAIHPAAALRNVRAQDYGLY